MTNCLTEIKDLSASELQIALSRMLMFASRLELKKALPAFERR